MASVLIPLAEGCEELEAVTLIDLFRRAQFTVITAALTDQIVLASRGTRIVADTLLQDVLAQQFDAIVLPGGLPGADNLCQDQRVITLLQRAVAEGKIAAAICAAPRVLAAAGLLEGKQATSYPGTLDKMPITGLSYSTENVVVDGQIVTSRGPGTAMEFALTLIALLANEELRDTVEKPLLRG